MGRRRRTSTIFLGLLATAGGVSLIAGVLLLARSLALVATGQRAEGVVVRNARGIGRRPAIYPIVSFEVDGRRVEITGQIGSKPAAHAVNDKVIVFYQPDDPENAVIGTFRELYLVATILSGIGVVLLGIGGGFLWVPGWLRGKRERIIAEGISAQAKVVDIFIDRSLRVNGRSPWVIEAEFQDPITGETIRCKSHYLWESPDGQYRVGGPVTVFYLPDRPQKCAFLLDKLGGD
jgi:hypothetical protein